MELIDGHWGTQSSPPGKSETLGACSCECVSKAGYVRMFKHRCQREAADEEWLLVGQESDVLAWTCIVLLVAPSYDL